MSKVLLLVARRSRLVHERGKACAYTAEQAGKLLVRHVGITREHLQRIVRDLRSFFGAQLFNPLQKRLVHAVHDPDCCPKIAVFDL